MFFKYLLDTSANFGSSIFSSTNNQRFNFSKNIALCLKKVILFPYHLNYSLDFKKNNQNVFLQPIRL